MSAEVVQDAIIKQIRNDADIFTEFGNTLTGNLSFLDGSATVTGAGTAFLSDLMGRDSRGAAIVKGGAIRAQGSTEWYKVASVESDTSLTLASNFGEADTGAVTGEHLYVRKGMPRNFNYVEDSRGIFLYQMLENWSRTQIGSQQQFAVYPFIISILYFDNDEEDSETRKTQYSKIVRRALERNLELLGSLPVGETITDLELQDTRFYFNPQTEGGYYLTIPLAVKRKEPIGDN
jgi:hypothetical protein